MNQSTSYVSNEDIPVTIDDTHKINTEHENVEANIEYDPNCHAMTDLDENETECSDENIWYSTDENDDDIEEPTSYDSGMWAGHTSFDDHNEANSIDDVPIDAPLIETEFMNLPKEVHREPMWEESGVFMVLEITPLKTFLQSTHQQMNMNCIKMQCSGTMMSWKQH